MQSDPLSWPMGGQNYRNTRSNSTQMQTNIETVRKLALRWKLDTNGDVSATPAVVGGAVYFPDWAGYMYKIDAKSGTTLWKTLLPSDGSVQAIARTSPAVVGNVVYIGDQNGYVEALSTVNGSVIWRTKPNVGPFPIITQSPVVYNGVVYVGSASAEEGVAANGAYPCCVSRGSFQALDALTGADLWKTYMTPEGYSGAAVWSSTPALDTATNTVYITTGNNYSIPQSATDCFASAGPDPAAQNACV
uniref:outer membrane protein assembly factor BamB family protein n=1 Tax=Deinococcus sp. TaxID=47478 RepID=UPI002869B528